MEKKNRKVGEVLKSKNNPKQFYVKFSESVSFEKNDTLQLRDPKEYVDFCLKQGWIKEGDVESRKSKIPDFVKFELILKTEAKSDVPF